MRLSTLALSAAFACAGASAMAAGTNGGQTIVVEGHPIELVSTDTELVFFVGDHDGKPYDTKGMSARAFVQMGGKTATVPLSPAPPNRMVGVLPAPVAKGTKIVMSTKLDGHNLQARFEK